MKPTGPDAYPGGKTWLVPPIREWLVHTRPEILIEPVVPPAGDRAARSRMGIPLSNIWCELEKNFSGIDH